MNPNVSLPESAADFVNDNVASGRFGSSSEVVREALRLMPLTEQEDAKRLAWLRDAWAADVASGDGEVVDFAALKAEARTRLAAAKTRA